uniref:L1 transposable element RRM domain-containing protein n=1 Tax=Podarcis muralis TaxID=64176 RepID=A0A670K8U4_PODMU
NFPNSLRILSRRLWPLLSPDQLEEYSFSFSPPSVLFSSWILGTIEVLPFILPLLKARRVFQSSIPPLEHQQRGKISRQEEIRDLDALWLKIKEEFRQNETHMEKKLGEMQESFDKKIEQAVGEMSNKIKDLTVRTKSLEDSNRKMQREMKDQRREAGKIKENFEELNKSQDQQLNLKFRGIGEVRDEDIKGKMTIELARWLALREDEVAQTIENAFRIKIRPKQNKQKKTPGDCLVIFRSIEMRNRILKESYQKKLIIDGRPIIIFKEIPIRLLRKREGYKQIVNTLRKNGIQHRWEFPEGISFFYKEKRFKITEIQEVSKFLHDTIGRFQCSADIRNGQTNRKEKKKTGKVAGIIP